MGAQALTGVQRLPGKLANLGAVIQLAYVPRDYDAALKYWISTLGVGPFFEWHHIQVDELVYRGVRIDLDFSVALSYWGDIQIELIQQHNSAPSIYRDWNSNALHHVQIAVDSYDDALSACHDAGFAVAMQGRGLLNVADLQFCYCDLGAFGPAGFLEFTHRPRNTGMGLARLAEIKNLVRGWNGSDPIRQLY